MHERLVSELVTLGFTSVDAEHLATALLDDFASTRSVMVATVVRLNQFRRGEFGQPDIARQLADRALDGAFSRAD